VSSVVALLWDVCVKILLFLIRFDVEKPFVVESVAFIDHKVHEFNSWTIFESINLLNSEIQYSTLVLDPLVMPKPSSM